MTDISTQHIPRTIAVAPSVAVGLVATLAMLAVYFSALTLTSGWDFTLSEFGRFWPYIVALTTGFGIQIGLYVYLRRVLAHHHGGKMLAASGTTSTAAMLSCCTHYLANVLPIIGAAGLVTFVAQYQVQLFSVGLAFNLAGIAFIGNKVISARSHI